MQLLQNNGLLQDYNFLRNLLVVVSFVLTAFFYLLFLTENTPVPLDTF